MSDELPPHFAQNHAVWGILEPILDTQVGVRGRQGNLITPPDPAREEAARELMRYMADQGIIFAIAQKVRKAKGSHYPTGDPRVAGSGDYVNPIPNPHDTVSDLGVIVGMCSLRIADFVMYSLTRSTIKADVIHDNARPTIGLLTQVALLGAGQDFDREYRDPMTGLSLRYRRHRQAIKWQNELRQHLGYEPSTRELEQFFAERSATLPTSSGKTPRAVTVDDLDIPPGTDSIDMHRFTEDEDTTLGDLLAEDEDAATARLDAAVAVGLMHRAISMWAPGSQAAQDTMRRYVAAWITIRSEPDAPEVVSVHQIVKVSGLPRRTAARMALAFDEHILPYVRDSLRPAQAQAHTQRMEGIEVIEAAIRAWAPEEPDLQQNMRKFTNEWFHARRAQRATTVEWLSKRLKWSADRTRQMMSAFEEHVLPVIEETT